MYGHSMEAASIPNPALKPFAILIGDWNTTGTHPLVPDTILHGRSTFEWIENGAFLVTRSEIDQPGFPAGLAIIGSDDALAQFFMLYFDERGVSRKLDVSLQDNLWTMSRTAPGFSQRFTASIVDEGNSILATWELSRDDATWQKDLELTYRRA